MEYRPSRRVDMLQLDASGELGDNQGLPRAGELLDLEGRLAGDLEAPAVWPSGVSMSFKFASISPKSARIFGDGRGEVQFAAQAGGEASGARSSRIDAQWFRSPA